MTASEPQPASPGDLHKVDFFSTETLAAPLEFLRRLRAEAPVFPALQTSHNRLQYLVTTYDLVQHVLLNPQQFSSNYLPILSGGGQDDPEIEAIRARGVAEVNSILTADDSDHRRMRKLIGTAFAPRRIKAMNEMLQTTAAELIDRFAARGECDFTAEFAARLPTNALAAIMGFGPERHDDVTRWGAAIARRFGQMGSRAERIADEMTILEAKEFMAEIIAQRRLAAGDDLISDIVKAEDADDAPLTEEEIFATIFILLVGGTETTFATLNWCLAHLLQNPEMLQRLLADENLIPAYADEILRYYTPVAGTWRIARENLTLGGVEINKGSILMVRIDSANRDERQFADPDRFDIDRPGNTRHLSFGGGPHSCLGFRVARMELQHSIAALLQRLKNPRINPERSDLSIVPSTHARCLKRLYIEFKME